MYPPRTTRSKTTNPPAGDNFEIKKKALIKKIVEYFQRKKKNSTLNFDLNKMKGFLNNYITNETLQTFNFDKFIKKLELDFTNFSVGNLNINSESKQENIPSEINCREPQQKTSSNNLFNYTSSASNEKTSNSKSPEKRAKLEILKEVKEKDDWAIIAKKNYENYLNEIKAKKQNQESTKNVVNEINNNQISEKRISIMKQIEENKKYEMQMKQEYENWVKAQEKIKMEKINKKETLIKSIDKFNNLKQSHIQEEELRKRKEDIEILQNISSLNQKEKMKVDSKKEAARKLYLDQLDILRKNQQEKYIKVESEKESGRKVLVEFDKIMEKKESERNDYRNSIKHKAKILDLRQSLVRNVKEIENEIKQEMEMKLQKEKNEIELRNKYIEDFNLRKKKELIESVNLVRSIQKSERINQEAEVKQRNQELARSIDKSYFDFCREKENIERKKREQINQYKMDLDKQLAENSLRRMQPLMDEKERTLNKSILN